MKEVELTQGWALVKDNIRNSRKKDGTSQFKGVHWDRGRWKAVITVDRKSIYIGRFINEKDAALAYKMAADKYFGEFSRAPGV